MAVVTFDTGQYTASTTAGLLVAASQQRTGLLIVNVGTNDVYIGNSSVTSSTGHLLPGTKGSSVSLPTRDAVYVISGSSTSVITFAEVFNVG